MSDRVNLHRRIFLEYLVGAAALTSLAVRAAAADDWSIATVEDLDALSRYGVELGIAECDRAAQLLGHGIVRADRHALVIGTIVRTSRSTRDSDRRPVISLDPLARRSGPCAFSVGLSAAERRALAAHWIESNGSRLPRGIGPAQVRVSEWHGSLEKYGASELNERFERRFHRPLDASAWKGWFAVKVLAEIALRNQAPPTCAQVAAAKFDGHKGRPLQFDADGHLRQPVYVVGGEPAHDRVLAEIVP
jgi:hypothetical protein